MEDTKIDARVIALDETELGWLGEDSKYVKQVLGVYLYDKNSHTHCCSLSPDYWLIHLYNQVVFTEVGEELTYIEKERLYEELEQTTGDDDCYMSVSDIDRLEEHLKNITKKSFRYCTYGDIYPDLEETREERIERLREYFCANHPL